jgi:hypothetical protein
MPRSANAIMPIPATRMRASSYLGCRARVSFRTCSEPVVALVPGFAPDRRASEPGGERGQHHQL